VKIDRFFIRWRNFFKIRGFWCG